MFRVNDHHDDDAAVTSKDTAGVIGLDHRVGAHGRADRVGRSGLHRDAQGLASIATSGGADAAKLRAQMVAIKASANTLATTITAVPEGSGSDPELAAVKASADQFTASVADLEASVAALEGKSGAAKVTGLATVASAARTSLSKLGATGQAIKAAAKDGKSSLGQAFAAAPSCNFLSAE